MIRQIGAADIPVLAEFARWTYAIAFGGSFSSDDLEHHLRERLSDDYFGGAIHEDVFLIAEGPPGLVGFVQFGISHAETAAPGDQELRRVYVHPDFQSQKIGSALIDAALEHPRLRNAPAIYLDVWEHNHRARALYERYGFTVVGSRKFILASGEAGDSDLIMVRRPGGGSP